MVSGYTGTSGTEPHLSKAQLTTLTQDTRTLYSGWPAATLLTGSPRSVALEAQPTAPPTPHPELLTPVPLCSLGLQVLCAWSASPYIMFPNQIS